VTKYRAPACTGTSSGRPWNTWTDWSDEAACFTDVAPDDLGVERLWETLPGPDGEPEENLFVLNNGQVASTLEIIRLIAGPRSGAGSRPGS